MCQRDVDEIGRAIVRLEVEEVARLLDGCCCLDTVTSLGLPLLELALAVDDPRMTRLLLAKGADVHVCVDGMTLLEDVMVDACDHNTTWRLDRLLSAGLDPDTELRPDYTLLMRAASSSPTVVDLLLERGASVDVRDSAGRSALAHAIAGGWSEDHMVIVERLLRAGADPRHRDSNGLDALGLLERQGWADPDFKARARQLLLKSRSSGWSEA